MTDKLSPNRVPLLAVAQNKADSTLPASSLTVKQPGSSVIAEDKENKENQPVSPATSKPSLRDRLLVRRARSKNVADPPDSGVFIDLTGSDDDSPVVVSSVSTFPPLTPTITSSVSPIPWKMAPVPPLILSSKVINGVKITSFAQLKSMVKSMEKPTSIQPPPTITAPVPPCPDLNDFISNESSENAPIPIPPPCKLPRLTLPHSQPSTSGLQASTVNPEPIDIEDLYSDDDTPLDSLLPDRNRLTYARRTSGLPIRPKDSQKSRQDAHDPCDRIPSRRKRGRSPI